MSLVMHKVQMALLMSVFEFACYGVNCVRFRFVVETGFTAFATPETIHAYTKYFKPEDGVHMVLKI
jgi:hypothetical protein